MMPKGHMGTELWLLLGISVMWMIGTSHGNLVMDAFMGNASIGGITAGQSSAQAAVSNLTKIASEKNTSMTSKEVQAGLNSFYYGFGGAP